MCSHLECASPRPPTLEWLGQQQPPYGKIAVKSEKQDDVVRSCLDVLHKNLCYPLQQYTLIHPCIFLACIEMLLLVGRKILQENLSIGLTFEDDNSRQDFAGSSDGDGHCCLFGIICRFVHVNCLAPHNIQSCFCIHSEIHWCLIHVGDIVLIVVRSKNLLFHLCHEVLPLFFHLLWMALRFMSAHVVNKQMLTNESADCRVSCLEGFYREFLWQCQCFDQ